MKSTTGYDFQGYAITEYLGVLTKETWVEALSNAGLIKRMEDARAKLLEHIESSAEELGANALIGVSYERCAYGSFIMVSLTATAVKIAKLADYAPLTEESIFRN